MEQRSVRISGECLVSVLVDCNAVIQHDTDSGGYTQVYQVTHPAAIQSG